VIFKIDSEKRGGYKKETKKKGSYFRGWSDEFQNLRQP